MAAPKNLRLSANFEEWFPEGLYLVGEIVPVTEYQSQEDRARNRPVRPRTDEATGLPLFRGTFADPAAEKDREKSVTVEFAAKVQPVPPAALAGVPFRPVVLEGMTVQPRAEVSGQAKQGVLWVLPTDYVADGRGWPDDIATIHPPLCIPCARLSIGLCPALRPDFVAIRAHSRVCGVTGVLFRSAPRFPVISPSDNGDVIGFRDPAIAWMQAAQLVRSLYGCTVVDLDRLDV
jgi:hypothetical protein